MLISLLRAIAEARGSTNQAELARKLGLSEALVVAMIADLVRMGYLAEVRAGCEAGACSGCSARKSCDCGEPSSPHLWSLTTAGRSAVHKVA
jgi:predicted transcriptional regulator